MKLSERAKIFGTHEAIMKMYSAFNARALCIYLTRTPMEWYIYKQEHSAYYCNWIENIFSNY